MLDGEGGDEGEGGMARELKERNSLQKSLSEF